MKESVAQKAMREAPEGLVAPGEEDGSGEALEGEEPLQVAQALVEKTTGDGLRMMRSIP